MPGLLLQISIAAIGAPLTGEFTRISGAVLWPDGSAAVGDLMNPSITWFDPKGVPVRTVGRNGSGPGEYRVVRSLVRCENGELAVFDIVLRRLTILSSDGKMLGSETKPELDSGLLMWCENSTKYITNPRSPQTGERPGMGAQFEEHRQLTHSDGRVLAEATTIFHFTGTAYSDIPFGERAEAASGGGVVYLCQTGAGTCTSFDTKTGRTQRFTVKTPNKEVTDADWLYERKVREEGLVGLPKAIRDGFRNTYDALPRPSKFGAFETVKADDRGRLWVRTHERYGQTTALWWVLSPAGASLSSVITPAGLEPLAWSGKQMLGYVRDEDGVPVLRRYEVALP